ncbi:hypothetical protein EIP91_007419 [Steccherinum ochraceum]|uniref:7alpha-cephem-methoxylase P8 chain n=1 Tax=Steccherinum ochraceum TaxID=92696 RepID=A0A4R0RUQ3_9APHY|nr:hypothetical protein EIP91_007419 [Steccherinum ochraceum]
MTIAAKEPASVTAELIYFTPPADGSKPFTDINIDFSKEGEGRNWTKVPHDIQIENLRGKEGSVTLDHNGFQFFNGASKHTSFANDAEVKAEYYPESIELVKKITGASRIVPFDHTVRRHRPGEFDDGPERRQPVPYIHVDQTPSSAIRRVHMHTSKEDAPKLLEKRFQIINLWRPIGRPAYDWPLTLCDFTSINYKQDLVPMTLKYPDRDGETFGVSFNENHKWKYLRGMTTNEFVLIKCYDSQEDGKTALLTPHTAFNDPSTPPDALLRESVELRLLVFYD